MSKISLIIPTFNESLNIKKLLEEIFISSKVNDFNYEAIVVDDGTDETAFIAEHLGAKVVKGQHKGLGQAIIDGINASQYDICVVMDADLSHLPSEIPNLINPIIKHGVDFCIGSRYVKGGDSSGWTKAGRLKSSLGTYPQWLITGVKDNNSGFFAFRKEILKNVELKADSWKIMLEILFKGKWISKLEVPIHFVKREKGESKNNVKERVKHAVHLLKLLFVHKMQRFWKFCLSNGVGTGVTFLMTWICTSLLGLHYLVSLFIATACAVCVNFIINAKWTFAPVNKAHQADYEWRSFYKGLPWQKRWKQKIARIVRNMAGDCGLVLELGCGSSPLGILTNHADYIGLDTNAEKIAYMQAKNIKNAKFEVNSCARLGFPDKTFDTVLFIEVIEHLEDINIAKQTLKEIYRVLKVGGQAIIATPNFGSWTGKAQDTLYGIFQKGAYKDEHNLKFDIYSLTTLCQSCGLEYVKSEIPANSDMIVKFKKGA